jgi:hypothetical protein
MGDCEQELEPVEVELSTRQENDQWERHEHKQIERDAEINWRSYDRRNIPRRWRA